MKKFSSILYSKKVFLFSLILVVFSIVFLSYGYAALNTSFSISGDAYVRVDADIRITGLSRVESVSGAYETYNGKYSKDSTSMFVTLPNSDSTLTYEVSVTNKSSSYYILTEIVPLSYTNSNIAYEIIDANVGSVINPNSTVKFKVKFYYSSVDFSNKNNTLVLNYKFSLDNVVAPTITGGSSDWVSTSPTIKISKAGSAVSGVDHYEYYMTTDATKPSASTVATGTTTDNVMVTVDGTNYIYYRTVSRLNNKSSWSAAQTVNLDTQIPSFTMLATGTYELSSSSTVVTDSNFGPSGGSVKCVNTSNSNTNVSKISSIKMIGTISVKCTATSNAGKSTTKTVNYTLGGTLSASYGLKCQDVNNSVNCPKSGSTWTVSPGYVQFGPYFKCQKGCYKITYSGSGFDSNTCQTYSVYQTSPATDYKLLSLKVTSTAVTYYINVTTAAVGNGIEFVFRNGCTSTTTLNSVKIEKVSSCPSS